MSRDLVMRNAPARRTTDKATCRMTSAFCGREEWSTVDLFTPRKASAGCACDESHAGARPKTTPVSKEMRKAKPRTGQEGLASMGMLRASGNASDRIIRERP